MQYFILSDSIKTAINILIWLSIRFISSYLIITNRSDSKQTYGGILIKSAGKDSGYLEQEGHLIFSRLFILSSSAAPWMFDYDTNKS